jgi:hypothetical protein
MPRNSLGEISCAPIISRLSSCSLGNRSNRSSKKCTLSFRPSQSPRASPAATSGKTRRQGRSLLSAPGEPLLQAFHPAGQCRRGSSTRSYTTSAPAAAPDQRRQPQVPLHGAGAAVATRCGRVGNRRGMPSARQHREAWNFEFVALPMFVPLGFQSCLVTLGYLCRPPRDQTDVVRRDIVTEDRLTN